MKYASLDKMIRINAVAFEGDFDKGGKPYILHLQRVAAGVPQDDYKAQMVAWGHDLMEDKPNWTPARLLDEGFHPAVVNSLAAMNHREGVPYMDYIKALADDYYARTAKKSDLRDNMDPSRLKGLTDKDFARMKKYQIAYAYLVSLDNV